MLSKKQNVTMRQCDTASVKQICLQITSKVFIMWKW